MIKQTARKLKIECVILLCATLVIQQSYSQESADSLGKYSYTIMGITNASPKTDMGTCFFIKQGLNLYLVTAKHVLYKCDSSSNKIYTPFNFAVVWIPNPGTIMQLPLTERKNDTCMSFENDTDMLVMSIDTKWSAQINSVEQFFLPPFKKWGSAEIYGQGLESDQVSLRFVPPHRMHIEHDDFIPEAFYQNTKDSPADSLHYLFEMKEINSGHSIKGFSGSPVFLQELKTKKWRLVGMLTGGYLPTNTETAVSSALVILKPEFITRALKKL